MNLIDLFNSLSIPNNIDEKRFNAIPIPELQTIRIAKDSTGNPVLLISVNFDKRNHLKNFRLKHFELVQNVECKIIEENRTTFQTFTVIRFISLNENLRTYFLRVAETLVKTLNLDATPEQTISTFNKFVEIFRSLGNPPTKTVQGLWTELFIIVNSANPRNLLSYWHNNPEDKFDFDSGVEKIEVKSSSKFERVHAFSSEQLNPPIGTQLLIASIFTEQNCQGKDIQDLIDIITVKIGNEVNLVIKLNSLVSRTLGNTLEQSIKIKFDENIARNSLRFYNFDDIKKIKVNHIPLEVSELKFKSNLSKIKPIDLNKIKFKRELFSSL